MSWLVSMFLMGGAEPLPSLALPGTGDTADAPLPLLPPARRSKDCADLTQQPTQRLSRLHGPWLAQSACMMAGVMNTSIKPHLPSMTGFDDEMGILQSM